MVFKQGKLFISVKAYLDGSGKSPDSFVTLAAFVANDATWLNFERGWEEVLKSGFRPVHYMHVVEALGLRRQSPFASALGWERKHIWQLLYKLAEYMSQFKGGVLSMHSCEIDMEAWRRITSDGYRIPSEIDLCNRYVSQYIVGLFTKQVLQSSNNHSVVLPKEDLLNFIFD